MTTGPTGGSGGTTHPGPFAALDILRRGRALLAAKAAKAGGLSRSATPLTAEQREDNYRRQAGRLTARQQRRIGHKAAQAAARATA